MATDEIDKKTIDDLERAVFGEDGEGLKYRMIAMETDFKNFKFYMVEKIDAIYAKTCGRDTWIWNIIGGIILLIVGFVASQLWKIK